VRTLFECIDIVQSGGPPMLGGFIDFYLLSERVTHVKSSDLKTSLNMCVSVCVIVRLITPARRVAYQT
ncbi:hypothetical protein BgiBS90_004536, partial [Biomphalaria glabrata]